MPEETPVQTLSAGEIGYIVTGIKEPGIASVEIRLPLCVTLCHRLRVF